ncbi:MAG TPA: lipopolysaccharide assembly protein LapA domain-containing protein [Acidimicrobiia bacterium]|nr:lipopolysaccharide assembly protein LapA domain-containing protein [Acidimicrobiia bacterium]
MNRPNTISSEVNDRAVLSPDVTAGPEPTARGAAKERVFVGTGLFWGLIIGVVLAIGVLILAAQNTGSITVTFMAWDFSTPLIVLILGAILIGVVFDELFGLFYRTRRRRTQRDRDHLQRLQRSQTPS